jgi:sortase A
MRRRAARLLSIGLAVLGLACGGEALWIQAKAELAQVLLRRAWLSTQRGEGEVRPWPWADTWPVARLRVPEQGSDMIVLSGATGRTLAFGPGHLAGSALPGAPGNTVLSGHRDTHFAFLREIQLGAAIELRGADGATRRYRVTERRVVHERETGWLAESVETKLTLITCYPFDAVLPGGPLRYVVTAHLVGSPSS